VSACNYNIYCNNLLVQISLPIKKQLLNSQQSAALAGSSRLATNCMLILSIGQTDCIRVQQTVGQRSNRIVSNTGSTYCLVFCN
jgi:hypothetical protein